MDGRIPEPRAMSWMSSAPFLLLVLALLSMVAGLLYLPSPPGGAVTVAASGVALSFLGSFLLAFVARHRPGVGMVLAEAMIAAWGRSYGALSDTSKQPVAPDGPAFGQPLRRLDVFLTVSLAVAVGLALTRLSLAEWAFAAGVLVLASALLLSIGNGIATADTSRWSLRQSSGDDQPDEALVTTMRRQSSPAEMFSALGARQSVLTREHATEEAKGVKKGTQPTVVIRRVQTVFCRTKVYEEGGRFHVSSEEVARAPFFLSVDLGRLEELRRHNQTEQATLRDRIVTSRSAGIFELAAFLEAGFRNLRLSPLDRIESTLQLCQPPNIEYEYDDSRKSVCDFAGKVIADYWRYPLETLYDRHGDCDCHAILAASLFYTLGYDCCVLAVETDAGSHLSIGVAPPSGPCLLPASVCVRTNGQEYYYCETAGASWHVGAIPSDVKLETLCVRWSSRESLP
jgi:hypothetical protein